MRKEMYLIRGNAGEDHRQFNARMLQTAISTAELINPDALKVTLTQEPPPKISIIPFRKNKIAVFSVFKEDHVKVDFLMNTEGFAGAFTVEEAIPVYYEKTWADREPTPGVCLLTLFHRKPGIDYDTFIHRWHNSHTPMSLRLHPLWNYNRNVVLQKMCELPVWYDGIVEEQTRTRSELLNPFKFFGNALEIAGNMISVYTDTRSFLDYKRIETYLAMEYHIVSYQCFQTEMSSQNQFENNQTNEISSSMDP
jgi:hypothetical protein